MPFNYHEAACQTDECGNRAHVMRIMCILWSVCLNAFNEIFFVIKNQNKTVVLSNSLRITLRKIMVSKYSNLVQ